MHYYDATSPTTVRKYRKFVFNPFLAAEKDGLTWYVIGVLRSLRSVESSSGGVRGNLVVGVGLRRCYDYDSPSFHPCLLP